MPRLGFGVFQAANAKASVATALAMGYRHVDSARYYKVRPLPLLQVFALLASPSLIQSSRARSQNEDEVCAAVHKFKDGMPNEGNGAVWLTTKVQGQEHGTAATAKAVDESAAIAQKYGLKWVRPIFARSISSSLLLSRLADSGPTRRTSSSSTTRRRVSRSASRRGRSSSSSATRASSSRRA